MILLILAIIFIAALLLFIRKNESATPATATEKPDYLCYTRHFKIAGLTHRCTRSDIGIIMGKVTYEPTNPHDKNAIAVIVNPEQSDERVIGYIRKDDQATFMNFAYKETELPFIGFIEEFQTEDGRASLFGKIKVFSGKDEDIETDMAIDIKYLTDAFAIRRYSERIDLLDAF